MPVDYFKNSSIFVLYKAGTIIFSEDQPGDVMFAVKEGEVEILHHGHHIETVHEGQFFGEMALIDKAPRSATAIARTDCKIVRVDKQKFLFLVQETPTFALQVMHQMSERLRRMTMLVDVFDISIDDSLGRETSEKHA